MFANKGNTGNFQPTRVARSLARGKRARTGDPHWAFQRINKTCNVFK